MSQPKVSIIIPTLSPKSKRYLDICMESIHKLDYPRDSLEIIISSPKGYAPNYDGAKVIHHEKQDREFAEAVNIGVEKSDPSSKHILLLSDDVIMTPESLKNLVTTAGNSDALFAATSNCDNYWKYHLQFLVEHKGEWLSISERFMRLSDVDYLIPAMMKAKSMYAAGAIRTDQLCFYATLIPRQVWNRLGPLDERFKTGYEDTDYCRRAAQANIPMFIVLDSLIWHFGGVTSSETLTPEVRLNNERAFFEKWNAC